MTDTKKLGELLIARTDSDCLNWVLDGPGSMYDAEIDQCIVSLMYPVSGSVKIPTVYIRFGTDKGLALSIEDAWCAVLMQSIRRQNDRYREAKVGKMIHWLEKRRK